MINLTDYFSTLEARRIALRARHEAEQAKPCAPSVPPLVDQLRELLANMAPAQRARISIPLLLPHLKGKYREHPHFIQIAKALRALGYRQVRSWKSADLGRRYWVIDNGQE